MHLVLGGARSGKSRFAEQLARNSGQLVTYIATAQSLDAEMQARIQRHQQDRPSAWTTLEVPLKLVDTLQKLSSSDFVIVDCLTLWLTNVFEKGEKVEARVDEFIDALDHCAATVVLVSNEISMGVVPMGELSRRFVDELGRLHQRIAAKAKNVTLMVAGLPHSIKSDDKP